MGRDAMRQGRLEETEHLFLAGMPFAPGTWGRLFGACIQRDMAGAFIYGSQIEKARAQLVELLAAYDDLRDRQGSAARHLLIGLTQLELGRYDAVRHHAERALTVGLSRFLDLPKWPQNDLICPKSVERAFKA